MTYNGKVYRKQGGDELVVASGGAITIEDATAIADLDQDISETYTEAEVQAISDKVDAILAFLRTTGMLPAS